MDQRISAAIPAADLDSILKSVSDINTKLPFLVGLDPVTFKRLVKVNNTRIPFVEQALALSGHNALLVPQFCDLAEANKDLNLYHDLDKIIAPLSNLLRMLEQTKAAAGSEAYQSARAIYEMAKSGKKKGIVGFETSADQLKVFFEHHGRNNKAPDIPIT
ncbi:MAG: hypothetical protein CFE21_16110 [Bacteroidetes bacterium B1(2017)]|nr:MAG: hypothetical protein CFE21_16110 [Bacteroidetes bacterium B1(2017)]